MKIICIFAINIPPPDNFYSCASGTISIMTCQFYEVLHDEDEVPILAKCDK